MTDRIWPLVTGVVSTAATATGVIGMVVGENVLIALITSVAGLLGVTVTGWFSTRRKIGEIPAQYSSILDELRSIRTSQEQSVQIDREHGRRLDGHDREIRDVKGRLSVVEMWQQQFGVSGDERLDER